MNTAPIGLVSQLDSTTVLDAIRMVKSGKLYSLDTGCWPGMPVAGTHPRFQVLPYRTPAGIRNEQGQEWVRGNSARFAPVIDLISGTTHSGTHVDALSHVTYGEDAHWFGNRSSFKYMGDFGPLECDASTMPPIVTRGVLVDVAGYLGKTVLPKSYAITRSDIEGALCKEGIEVLPGDTVLVRTGFMQVWSDPERAPSSWGSGLDLESGTYLADRGAVVIGADTEGLEVHPSIDPKNPLPLHEELLTKRGILILELANLEEIAKDGVYEFCFICLPLRIRGATGSLIRPLALI